MDFSNIKHNEYQEICKCFFDLALNDNMKKSFSRYFVLWKI